MVLIDHNASAPEVDPSPYLVRSRAEHHEDLIELRIVGLPDHHLEQRPPAEVEKLLGPTHPPR